MSEWVSVKDRLPERQGEYLVYATDNPDCAVRDFPEIIKACFALRSKNTPNIYPNFKEGFYIKSMYAPGVTHWMPLPAPPGEDSVSRSTIRDILSNKTWKLPEDPK